MKFSNSEYADFVFCYGKADGNSLAAQRMYAEAFPQRDVPHHTVFNSTFDRLRETGCVNKCRGDRTRGFQQNAEETVLAAVLQDPTTSVRKIAKTKEIPQSQVFRILKHHKLHPYHYTPVQSLHEGDCEKRIEFCTLMLAKDTQNENFLKKILWTDESIFNREGITNFHNLHFYAQENPHKKLQTKHQNRFSVNVWAGLIGNCVIGPHFLPDRLNATLYMDFLQNELRDALDNLPLATLAGITFQQDGCPVHSSIVVKNFLNSSFGTNWIGRNGPIKWPPRSPDLTPLDFYVWGRAKELVYNEEIISCNQLKRKIKEAFQTIQEEITLDVTTAEIRRRYVKCTTMHGSHFEHL